MHKMLFAALFLLIDPAIMDAQCPTIAGIMVDACGTENHNEFIFIRTGSNPLHVDDLAITFPTNGSITVANTNDFSPPLGTSVPPTGACVTVLDDGATIPANASVIIFMSNNVSQTYDFTSWCTQYGVVYLLYRNLSPTTPTYLNNSPTPVQRTTTLSVNGMPACTASYSYDVPLTSTDGNFYQFPPPVAGASESTTPANNGCASPPFHLLPLVLTSFTAEQVDDAVNLHWTTSSEQQTLYFDIEKSTDGQQFKSIDKVPAAGNSTTDLSYHYRDAANITGKTWYRLRMVDMDGRAGYSRILMVNPPTAALTLLNLKPNPVVQDLTVEWNAPEKTTANLVIVDHTGRIVSSRSVNATQGVNKVTLPVQSLRPGVYNIRLLIDNRVRSRTFIKQ